MNASTTLPISQAVQFVPLCRPIQDCENVIPKHNRYKLFPDYRPPREISLQDRCFIHRLPDDLLRSIFVSYVHDSKQDKPEDYRTKGLTHKPDFRSHDDFEKRLRAVHAKHKPALTSNLSSSASPYILVSVCKRWRPFGLSPTLWASLAVYKPRKAQLTSIIDWLKRSTISRDGSCNVERLLYLYLYAPAEDEYELSTVGTILDIFLSKQALLRHMTIKVAEYPRRHNFPMTIQAPYLALVELDFGVSYVPTCLLELVNQQDTRLKKLIWRPALTRYMSLASRPWARLTHFKLPILDMTREWSIIRFHVLLTGLIHCENLEDLEIAMAGPSIQQPDIKLFESNPVRDEWTWKTLRECGSDYCVSTFSDGVIEQALKYRIVLPRLLRLKFEGYGYEADPFLFRINAPRLRSLEIINHKDLRLFSSGIFSSLMSSLLSSDSSSHPVLTHLSIIDLNMDKVTLVNLLAYPLPELRHLELCVPPVGNRVMRALMLTETHEGPMPNIRKLVLPKCTAWNGRLVDMVMSRRPMLKELRYSLPKTNKTGSGRPIAAVVESQELYDLRNATSDLSEEQFSLVLD